MSVYEFVRAQGPMHVDEVLRRFADRSREAVQSEILRELNGGRLTLDHGGLRAV